MFYYVSIKFVDLMHFIFITYIKLKNLNFFFFLDFIFSIIICVVLILFVLISVAFFTLLERKKLASFQRRRGPNVEGSINGILQPIADGFKLIFKESILPSNSLNKIFILAPIMAF
jgi:NADH-quinone oxidoreductase subunit H